MAVSIIILNCTHCGFSWLQRFPNSKPKGCPACKSLNYEKPRQKVHYTKKKRTL